MNAGTSKKNTTVQYRHAKQVHPGSLVHTSKSFPHMEEPPVPSPKGSPVWTMKFLMTRWKIKPL